MFNLNSDERDSFNNACDVVDWWSRVESGVLGIDAGFCGVCV
jgi:hypothetical protein